jgi:AcrR family transcriptional regulator
VHNVTVAERWTQERRRQHTRDVLLDAAEEVFARRGFEGASLEEIADAAGYTRGAIYKHFGSKEELFLSANERFNERALAGFLATIDPSVPVKETDLAGVARQWRGLQASRDARQYALGSEFNLYVLRHPEIRPRVAAHRRRVAEIVGRFIEQQAARFGTSLRIPAITLARIALAAGDGLEMANYLDEGEDDLYEPFLELLLSAWQDAPALTPVSPPE